MAKKKQVKKSPPPPPPPPPKPKMDWKTKAIHGVGALTVAKAGLELVGLYNDYKRDNKIRNLQKEVKRLSGMQVPNAHSVAEALSAIPIVSPRLVHNNNFFEADEPWMRFPVNPFHPQ